MLLFLIHFSIVHLHSMNSSFSLFLRLFSESFLFAFQALRVNKLRTFLSLLGITIGIFAIISVFTVTDSLERKIRNDVSSLGNNVIYVQKWPWVPEGGGAAVSAARWRGWLTIPASVSPAQSISSGNST